MTLIGHIIDERRRQSGGGAEPDLSDLLATGQSESNFSADQSADQVATLVVAGHATTAAVLFWSLYLIASAPEEQDVVAAEAASVDLRPEGAADAVPQLSARLHRRAVRAHRARPAIGDPWFAPFGSGLANLAWSEGSRSSELSRLILRPSGCSFAASRAPRRFVPSQSPFLSVQSSPAWGAATRDHDLIPEKN
jgi:hypothetical protein